MRCRDVGRLAAAAAGQDELALVHAATCTQCSGELAAMTDVTALARRLPVRGLTSDRRAALAAEVLAAADAEPVRGSVLAALREILASREVVAGVAVAAAIIAIVVAWPERTPPALELSAAPPPALDEPQREVAYEAAPPPAPASEPPRASVSIAAQAGAQYRRAGDVIELADGTIAIDASAPIAVVTGGVRVAITRARAEITAQRGAITTVRVFAGAVSVDDHGRRVIVRDSWTPNDAARAFRDGWAALRDGRDGDAIALFDRATDPSVAEDAAYWAAITAERIRRPDAADRLRAFIAQFPGSPRIGAARAALDRDQ